MTAPDADVERLVGFLDSIVADRPRFPSLVVALTSDDECCTAQRFLGEYHQRLSAENKNLIPHAFVGRSLLADRPSDVDLFRKIVNKLKSTLPQGAGRRPRFIFFDICHDVITADGVQDRGVDDPQRKLRDHLYLRWAGRTPWSELIQNIPALEALSKIFVFVAKVVFLGLHRWWFERRLNRRLSWFSEHVTGSRGEFLSQALEIAPGGEHCNDASLRCKILLDGLLRDLDRLIGRRRFLPRHRRRRWTPVLFLDCAGSNNQVCVDIVRSFMDLGGGRSTSPLIVIAAISPEENFGLDDDRPVLVTRAVERLKSFVDHDPPAPTLIRLQVPDADRLITPGNVTPRIPGTWGVWKPVVILTVSVLLFGLYIVIVGLPYPPHCPLTDTNSGGERYGLMIDDTCGFTPVAQDPTGFPDLPDLERQIRENNARVDDLKGPLGYRYVVFFAPLTRPAHVVERTQPANALWQLSGAVKAQKTLNDLAETDQDKVPIKLLLANSADLFDKGPDVASTIANQRQDGQDSIAAVIGISQSRTKTLEAFNNMPNIPIIGSTITGNKMTEGKEKNFFMISPANNAFAERMARWVRDNKIARGLAGWMTVYDPNDVLFSKDLRDSLRGVLSRELRPSDPEDDVVVSEQGPSDGPTDDVVRSLCDKATRGILPVLTVRPDQLTKIFATGDHLPECNRGGNGGRITMLAGPGAIVFAASGRADKYPWLNLAYTALG